jgi:ketosteroid isomerase-like protein
MSEENVEAVRRLYDAFSTGDFARALEQAEPDFEWIPPERDIQGPVQGPHELQRLLRDQEEAYEEFRIEAEELTDHGDQVVAFVRIRGRGRTSGVEFDIRAATVWTGQRGCGTIRMYGRGDSHPSG